MTDEQKVFLARRLEDAASVQPELTSFRELLLGFGGLEFVPPGKPDSDLTALLLSGRLMTGPISAEELDAGHCHENVAELWMDKGKGLTAIGVGYALSDDELWRQHSWGMRDDEIVETTAKRLKYFGLIFQGGEADRFAKANEGDPEDRRWRRLPEIWFRLQRDDDGYPPKDWEGLKSELTGPPGAYRIKCIPFFARDIAYDDVVAASVADDGDYLVFRAVLSRSGYSTIRLWLDEGESRDDAVKNLVDLGCLVESAANFGHRLIGVAVPRAIFAEVDSYIALEKDKGRWGVQDGYLSASPERTSSAS